MNILPEVIKSLTKEEIRNFKLFINRTNSTGKRKDEKLFELIKYYYPTNYNEEKIYGKLYEQEDEKSSYYRLKNRLLEDIGISLSQFFFHLTDIHFVLNNYLLCKSFVTKNEWDIAKFYLAKAEKKATEIEDYELLELIYSELIKLSHEVLNINPEQYILKRKENRLKLNSLQELDDVLAMIIYRVRTTQNFSGQDKHINTLLEKTVSDFSTDKSLKKNSQFKFKIYHALSRILLSKKDYKALEDYLLKTYGDFTKSNMFNKNTHDTKLQMLTYISNALFVNGKHNESLKYAKLMHESIHEFNNMLHDKYIFFYYNTLVNNYSRIDTTKAIETLNEAKDNKAIMKHPYYMGYVYLNLATSFFDLKDFKQSLRSLVKLYTHANYKNLDTSFRFKISMAELIIRYQLDDIDYILSRIKQLRKEFSSIINLTDFIRDKEFIELLEKIIDTTDAGRDKKLKERTKKFLLANHAQDSTEIINYNNWLSELFRLE